jgi:hypothetical protein
MGRVLKKFLLALYKGWKVRKIMESRTVTNAIAQAKDYIGFINSMEGDSSVNDSMRQ